jgi:hypothetical protein
MTDEEFNKFCGEKGVVRFRPAFKRYVRMQGQDPNNKAVLEAAYRPFVRNVLGRWSTLSRRQKRKWMSGE